MVSEERLRVIVAGGRDFRDRDRLYGRLDYHFRKFRDEELEIVHGGAKEGADKYADDYAKECGLQFKVFNADWNRFGNSAGPRRNKEMAKYAHALIAFWDGSSKGTKSMIDFAKQYKLPYTIYYY
jgi:YspA, cpYpsA-related SLOG family